MELWFHSGVWAPTPAFSSSPFSPSLSLSPSLSSFLSLSAVFEPSEIYSWSWERGFLVNVQVCAFVKAIILHNEWLSWKQVKSKPWTDDIHHIYRSGGSQHVLWFHHAIKPIRCNVIHKSIWGRTETHNNAIINYHCTVSQGVLYLKWTLNEM